MHIKFLHHGTGDPNKAVTYLLSDRDHNGVQRPEVKVLRGNPELLASLVSSLRTVHRYTSSIVAWAAEDQPSPKEVSDVLDDFERLAFAGLDPDQYCHAVVSHGDHVHILVARVELQSGKSMNIAPPPWRQHFDHLRNYWNFKSGWARPDDPARARLVQRDAAGSRNEEQAVLEAERVSAETGFEVSDLLHSMGVEPRPKVVITDRLLRLVSDGEVKNRQDVLAILAEYGPIHREGKDYVSIRLGEDERPIRFRGAMFHEDFDASTFLKRASAPTPVGRAKPDLVAAEAARLEMMDAISQRAAYNRKRFPAPVPVPIQLRSPIEPDNHKSLLQPTAEDKENERNRNDTAWNARRGYRSIRAAVARLVRVCLEAVTRSGSAERAIAAAQRAGSAVQRARSEAQRGRSDAQRASTDAHRVILETERACRNLDTAIAALRAGELKAPVKRSNL